MNRDCMVAIGHGGKIIYAVNSGSYSDYKVNALYSTKEKAEDHMKFIPNGQDYNDIEEFELDPTNIDFYRRGYQLWRVVMLVDGTTLYTYITESYEKVEHQLYPRRPENDLYLYCTVWAKTEQAAVKIVNEHRTQLIASNKWNLEELENG